MTRLVLIALGLAACGNRAAAQPAPRPEDAGTTVSDASASAPPASAPQAPPPVIIQVPVPPAPQPQARAPTPPPPVIIQVPVPGPPWGAPQVPPTINDAGVVVPAVPLFIDPGAPPGTPGNGAPDTTGATP
jgi:hypothetical protein